MSIERVLNGELPTSDQYQGTELVTSVGLALRGLEEPSKGLNLLPVQIVQDRQHRNRSSIRKNLMILFFMIAMLVGGGGYLKWYEKFLEHRRVDNYLMDLQQETSKISTMRKKIAIVENYLDTQQSCLNVIQKVLEVLPPQTYIATVRFTKRKTFEIIGQAINNDDVNKITEALINLRPSPDQEKYFTGVVPQTTTMKTIDLDAKKMQVYEFKIYCALRWNEQDPRNQ